MPNNKIDTITNGNETYDILDKNSVQLEGNQEISGLKNFSTGIYTKVIQIGNGSGGISLEQITTGPGVKLIAHGSSGSSDTEIAQFNHDGQWFFDTHVCPSSIKNLNLGDSTAKWNNLYLKGVLSDGTNSISIANIASKAELPDISNMLTTNTVQSISGQKTFADDTLRITNIKSSGGILMIEQRGASTNGLYFNGTMEPNRTNTFDIGSSNKTVRDLYLSRNLTVGGNITDGSNSVKVADIATKNYVDDNKGTKLYYHSYNDLDSEIRLNFLSKTSTDLKGNLFNLYNDLVNNGISISVGISKSPVLYMSYDGTKIIISYLNTQGNVTTKEINPTDYIEGSPVEY